MTQKVEQVYHSRKVLILNNFLGGIAWGVGSVIGATVVVAVIGVALARAKELPLIGAIAENIMTAISERR